MARHYTPEEREKLRSIGLRDLLSPVTGNEKQTASDIILQMAPLAAETVGDLALFAEKEDVRLKAALAIVDRALQIKGNDDTLAGTMSDDELDEVLVEEFTKFQGVGVGVDGPPPAT